METDTLTLTHTAAVLTDYATALLEAYKAHHVESGRPASHLLLDTAAAVVDTGDGWVEVSLRLQDYWKYIEFGTAPHWPPRDAIERWIEVKPVVPYPDSRGRIPSTRQLAYLICRKIAEEGTEGSEDLLDAVEQVNAEYDRRIEEAVAADLEDIAGDMLRTLVRSWVK